MSKSKSSSKKGQGVQFGTDESNVKFLPEGIKDTFARVSLSTVLSPAYRDLTGKQAQLLVIAKGREFASGKARPMVDFPNQGFTEKHIYLNYGLMAMYGVYKGDSKGFYRDVKALVDHGFLEVVSEQHYKGERKIYKLSGKWADWNENKG